MTNVSVTLPVYQMLLFYALSFLPYGILILREELRFSVLKNEELRSISGPRRYELLAG
jgi:hypothetical protein